MPITGSVSGSMVEFGFSTRIPLYSKRLENVFSRREISISGKNAGTSTFGWTNVIPIIRTGGSGLNSELYTRATQSFSVGNPPPSLELHGKTLHRFKWALTSGLHTIQVDTLQFYSSSADDRPSLCVMQNQDIGMTSSIEVFASPGVDGWTTIGPVPLTATYNGWTWVELRSNCVIFQNNPCYFDKIITT